MILLSLLSAPETHIVFNRRYNTPLLTTIPLKLHITRMGRIIFCIDKVQWRRKSAIVRVSERIRPGSYAGEVVLGVVL